jgi:hypothetical protein
MWREGPLEDYQAAWCVYEADEQRLVMSLPTVFCVTQLSASTAHARLQAPIMDERSTRAASGVSQVSTRH